MLSRFRRIRLAFGVSRRMKLVAAATAAFGSCYASYTLGVDSGAADAGTDAHVDVDAGYDAGFDADAATDAGADAGSCPATCASALAQVQLHLEVLDCQRFLACPVDDVALVACVDGSADPCRIIDEAAADAIRNVCPLDLVECPEGP